MLLYLTLNPISSSNTFEDFMIFQLPAQTRNYFTSLRGCNDSIWRFFSISIHIIILFSACRSLKQTYLLGETLLWHSSSQFIIPLSSILLPVVMLLKVSYMFSWYELCIFSFCVTSGEWLIYIVTSWTCLLEKLCALHTCHIAYIGYAHTCTQACLRT